MRLGWFWSTTGVSIIFPENRLAFDDIEPVLCCRLVLNTYHTLRPHSDVISGTAVAEAPTELFAVTLHNLILRDWIPFSWPTFTSLNSTASTLLPEFTTS